MARFAGGGASGTRCAWNDGRVTVFLSVAPHPDDEVIGAGPLGIELLAHGHEVHVLCASLGRPEQHERRAAEAQAGAARAGWVLHLPAAPVAMSRGDDLEAAEAAVADLLAEQVDVLGPDVIVGPGPHDAHHAHELVARAISSTAVDRAGLRWWAWQTWGHLVVQNLVVPFEEAVLEQAMEVLDCYAGELARSDYGEALVGAAMLGAALGHERAFGYGTTRTWTEPYANVFCESIVEGGRWAHGIPRVLDPRDPLQGEPDRARSASWLGEPSPYQPITSR